MPNKYGKGYGSNNRVTSRTPAPLDTGGVRPTGDSRNPLPLGRTYRRVTSRTGNQIPNPVEEQNQTSNNMKRAAQAKLIEATKSRVGAKIPTNSTLVATKGVRTAAAQRLQEMSRRKGK